MKDIHGVEVKTNDTVRFCPVGTNCWDEYVIDGVEGGFVSMHNVFGPIFLSSTAGLFEVLPERILTKEDFKTKKE